MARFLPFSAAKQQSKAVHWVGELIAGCAFVVLAAAVLCGPYLLGLEPDVESGFVRGVK